MELAEPGELFKVSEGVTMVVSTRTSTTSEKNVEVERDEIIMYLETKECNSGGFYHWFLTSKGERVPFYFPHWLEQSLKVHGSAPDDDIFLHKVEI